MTFDKNYDLPVEFRLRAAHDAAAEPKTRLLPSADVQLFVTLPGTTETVAAYT